MNYNFNDLAKEKNFIGFESGVVCFYPNYNDLTFLDPHDCKEALFFQKNYMKDYV